MSEKVTNIGHTSARGWHDLPVKDKLAHITAVSSFAFGWILIFTGLILPPMGVIDATVITVFGMAICYCGAMYGIINYVKNGQMEIYQKVDSMLKEK